MAQALAHPLFWNHQQQSYTLFSKTPRGMDFSDPGTGKTAVQACLYNLRPKQARGRLLVLCPKTLMVSAWAVDLEKFAPTLTVSLAYADQREEAFQLDTDVVIMNHDGVKWLAQKENLKYLAEFDHLVIDEITAFKHPTSQRSKAMLKLRSYFKYRYGMTGTPNPNTVMELWHPMMIIDDGKRLGNSYFKLRSKVQVPTQVGPDPRHLRWDDTPGAGQAVNDIIADITMRHDFEEVMTHVPANHRHTKTFALSKRAKAAYDKMEQELIMAMEDGKTVNAVHAASLRTKLLQIASGAVYNTDGGKSYSLIDTGRYELIADLVEETKHSVVFFNWTHQREELRKLFTSRDISFAIIDGDTPAKERVQIVADYQAGKYQTVLLHPKTGAHGLTLTRGTLTIFSSPIYEADYMKQAIARIYRGTQDQVTNTVFIEAANTVEGKVYARLNDKAARMDDFLDMVKQRSK